MMSPGSSAVPSPQSPRAQRLPSLERIFHQPSIHLSLFEDKVFGHDDWRKHRNAAWRHRIEPTVFCRVAVGFIWQLVAVALVSVGVGLLHTFMKGRDSFLSSDRLTAPFSMITFALSLLLVFKTNSSYSRWWEGRIIWGQVVNFGRNYVRQALMWFPDDRPELLEAAVRWAAAAPRVLLAHLREGTDVVAEVRGVLTNEEVDWLRTWSNGPLGAGTALGQLVVAAGLPPQLQAEIQKQVELYTNCAGGCERIFKTPIPPAYARHTSRFLMLYVVVSPVLLWPSTGWLTPLVAVVIAFLLLGVENIGVQVEEPFHVLPLYDICRALEANIMEMHRAFSARPGGRPSAAELANATAARRARPAPAVEESARDRRAAAGGGAGGTYRGGGGGGAGEGSVSGRKAASVEGGGGGDASGSRRRGGLGTSLSGAAGVGGGSGTGGSPPKERRLSIVMPSNNVGAGTGAAAALGEAVLPFATVDPAAEGTGASGRLAAVLAARLSAPLGGNAAAARPSALSVSQPLPAAAPPLA